MFPDLEFHHIQAFIAVARTENFTKAAEQLGLSQSALSRSVQKLEQQIGQPLFDRKPRQVTLTAAGEKFLPRAVEIINLVEDTFQEVTEADGRGHIRLAAIPTIAPYLLPVLLKQFSEKHPSIKISVTEDTSELIIKKCLQGEVDAAIIALPFEIENLQSLPLFEEELYLVMPNNHPLGEQKEIAIQDLSNIPFIMLSGEHCLSEQVELFCRMESMEPISIERTSQLATVQELVSLEHGISIIPEMARSIDSSDNRIYRPFKNPAPRRTIALVTNADRYQSRALKHWIDFLQQYNYSKLAV